MSSVTIDRRAGLSSSAAIKGPCRAATTANITLSGHQTIDDIAVVTGDRVLVKDQTDARYNGLYIVDTGDWSRCKDFSRNDDVVKGTRVVVTDGTSNAGGTYQVDAATVNFDIADVTFAFVERISPADITNLTSASTLTGAEQFAVIQSGNSRKSTVSAVWTYIKGLISGSSLATSGVSTLIGVDGSGALVNGYAPITHAGNHGCALDGTTNDLTALQAVLNAVSAAGGGVVSTGGKSAKINGTLVIPQNVTLDFGCGVLQLTNTTDKVKLSSNSLVQNITISALNVTSYVGPALQIDDADGYNRNTSKYCGGGRGVRLVGPGTGAAAAGTGLYIHGNGGAGITEIVFPDLVVQNFDYGIRIHGQTSWVNSGWVKTRIYGCKRFITCEGNTSAANEVAGWTFEYQIQPNTSTPIAVYGISDDGARNKFLGTTWDWDISGSSDGVIFTSTAHDYVLCDQLQREYIRETAGDGASGGYIETLAGLYRYPHPGPLVPSTTENSAFTEANDCLCFADEFFTVTSSGDAFTNLSNAFRQGDSSATCTLTGTGAVVKVDFGATKNYFAGAGVLFGFAQMCAGVKIEYSTDDVTYTTLVNITNNAFYEVSRIGQTFLANLRYLRFTFTGNGTTINVQRLFAYVVSLEGTVWLSRSASRYNVPAIFFSKLAANRTLSDVNTAQNWFETTEDEVTLQSSTIYEFEGRLQVERTAGTTSHTIALLFGGTATINNLSAIAVVSNPNTGSIGAASMLRISTASATTLTTANTSATESLLLYVRGTVRITAGGTFIPQIQYSAAPGGAPTAKKDSTFSIWKAGSSSVVSVGPWS